MEPEMLLQGATCPQELIGEWVAMGAVACACRGDR